MPTFSALAAGPFKPKSSSEFCLEGIKRLRGCSTSIESNNIIEKTSPTKDNLNSGLKGLQPIVTDNF
jgi:hypothetical protein